MAHRSDEILKRLPAGPVVGAEIGVFSGATSARLLQREDLRLYMIDTWAPFKADGISVSEDDQRNNLQSAYDSTLFACLRRYIIPFDSISASKSFADESLDFVFIDANHYYDAVAADIETWRHKVTPGGILCGHDYANYEYDYGEQVERAVKEAASRHNWKIETGDDFTWFVRV